MKKGIRVLSIDDSPFKKVGGAKVLCIGVVSRGASDESVEGILSFHIKKDGLNSTDKLISTIRKSGRFGKQIRLILVHSVTLGGFNILDLKKVYKFLKIPVIAVTRKKADEKKVLSALKNLRDWKKRAALLKNAGESFEFNRLHFHCAGISAADSRGFLKTFKGYPWPLRLAHLIASGVVLGESRGRA
ncbi:DUF99 family protein [Candidatus Micrarchaeota archaeon]|nr:DUF99 family protein [Candidatus Micrarchaeota archaeon]